MSLALSGSVTSHWTANQPDAETSAFTDRSRAARYFIGAVIAAGIGALFMQPPGASYAHPAVFLALLSAAAVASVFKVELPLSHHGATMSLSFAFEFAALLMLGTHATMVIAASSAWVQCTAARGQRNPLHRTAFSMAALVVTSFGAGAVFEALGGRGGWNLTTVGGLETPAIVAATCYFVLNTLLVASAVSLETIQPFRKVWNEHVGVERARLRRRRGRGRGGIGALRDAQRGPDPAGADSAVSDPPDLRALLRSRGYRAGPRARDVRSAPGDGRGARAGHRRQGPDGDVAHPPGAGLRGRHCPGDGHGGAGSPGPADRRAAARHRQAGRARAHPVEAGPADAGRVPADAGPSAGRRGDHRARALPVPRGADHPEPSRALGRQGLSERTLGPGDPARRAHSRRGGLLRRAHLGPPVPQGVVARRGARADQAGGRQGARPRGRRDARAADAAARGGGRRSRPSPRIRCGSRRAARTAAARSRRRRRTSSTTSRWRIARSTRSTRSRSRWAPASAWPTRWRWSRRS